ncbi:hypothetical protein F511_18461 [Dorcoceras hygrometricum]|uniref:Uncharacterized protein n=1 Tax=Dorcoceras hygrometricum TaxID=472368 RepID=A0A2Z7BD51_9LAMI|nr:hypothetical protein F511_18461 [Dorcoceras hygrometricum]
MAIESLATLGLPMVVDSIGIFEFNGSYCTLTMTDWFLQALSVIPRRSWGDVARHFIMIRWCKPTKELRFRSWTGLGVAPAVQPLKGQFSRGTGRSQAPSRQQAGSGYAAAPTVMSELGFDPGNCGLIATISRFFKKTNSRTLLMACSTRAGRMRRWAEFDF